MIRIRTSTACITLLSLTACARTGTGSTPAAAATRVGPSSGAVLVVGGGAQGPEIFQKFIELAGGPDALIVEVPTAGGDSLDASQYGRGLRAAGARNVVVYHTTDRAVADADSFVAKIADARGVWFGGGRHYRLVNSYMGTKSQRAFEAVLARGGVVGGSSAGASILASYLVRGAPSNDNRIMNHPQYLEGFGYLRNTAIDQHVVARDRLADLHDSLTSRRPDLLGLSEDEGTAWLVRGDTAEVIGRGLAFVYNSRDANDAGKPYVAFRAGDRFNLATRRVMSRAISGTKLTRRFVDDVVAKNRNAERGAAAVLVAQNGKVLVDAAYGVPPQRRYMPETAVPNMPLLGMAKVLDAALGASRDAAAIRRVQTTGGMQRARYDSTTRNWMASVDDLYRYELGRHTPRPGVADTAGSPPGFATDTFRGLRRQFVYGRDDGTGGAWVRFPESRTVILVLSSDDSIRASRIAESIAERLLVQR